MSYHQISGSASLILNHEAPLWLGVWRSCSVFALCVSVSIYTMALNHPASIWMSCVDLDSTAEQTHWEIQAVSDNSIICNSIFTFVVSSYKIAVVPSVASTY